MTPRPTEFRRAVLIVGADRTRAHIRIARFFGTWRGVHVQSVFELDQFGAFLGHGTDHLVDLPHGAVATCRGEPGCVLIVQAMSYYYWQDDGMLVVREGRSVGVVP